LVKIEAVYWHIIQSHNNNMAHRQNPVKIISKFLPVFNTLIEKDFKCSSEGSTNGGCHEQEVANFFHERGFPITEKTITAMKPKSKKEYDIYIMNRTTHSPTEGIQINRPDGFYTILQPYSKTGRGAMNPSPDIYLIYIKGGQVVEWLGIECKSSKDSLCPMWNEHLPRAWEKGNILYFFSGYNKETNSKQNTIFTSDIFFNGRDGSVIEENFWKEVRSSMMTLWQTKYAPSFPMVECKLRQFCGQVPFTSEAMVSMVVKTREFLETRRTPA